MRVLMVRGHVGRILRIIYRGLWDICVAIDMSALWMPLRMALRMSLGMSLGMALRRSVGTDLRRDEI